MVPGDIPVSSVVLGLFGASTTFCVEFEVHLSAGYSFPESHDGYSVPAIKSVCPSLPQQSLTLSPRTFEHAFVTSIIL